MGVAVIVAKSGTEWIVCATYSAAELQDVVDPADPDTATAAPPIDPARDIGTAAPPAPASSAPSVGTAGTRPRGVDEGVSSLTPSAFVTALSARTRRTPFVLGPHAAVLQRFALDQGVNVLVRRVRSTVRGLSLAGVGVDTAYEVALPPVTELSDATRLHPELHHLNAALHRAAPRGVTRPIHGWSAHPAWIDGPRLRGRHDAWRRQQANAGQRSRVAERRRRRKAAAAAPPPDLGATAFTAWGEIVLLSDSFEVDEFLADMTVRLAALPNGTTSWSDGASPLRYKVTGIRWVPVRPATLAAPVNTGAESAKRIIDTARDADDWKPAPPGAGTAPTGYGAGRTYLKDPAYLALIHPDARPFVDDSRVRAEAFAEAASATPTDEKPMEWISARQLLVHAFKNGRAVKRLLPIGTVLYKFNAYTGIQPNQTEATVADFAVSPWWSAWQAYDWGSSFADRISLAKVTTVNALVAATAPTHTPAPAAVAAVYAASHGATVPPAPPPPPPRAAANQRLAATPVLELSRLTSVVREDWSSLRYVVAIALTRPVYAFFGDFASMERIGLVPVRAPREWPDTAGERIAATPAKLGSSSALRASKDESEVPIGMRVERATLDLASTKRRAMELPGGSTQFYIPGLTMRSFEFVSLDETMVPGSRKAAGVSPGVTFSILDLGWEPAPAPAPAPATSTVTVTP